MRNHHFIIDAHCHIFPDKIAERAAENIGAFYKIPVAAPATVQNMLALMEQQGIDLAIVSSSAMNPQQVSKVNEFILQSAQDHPDKIVPVGTLHPHCSEAELESHLHFLLDHHFHGVKIHPDMLSISVNDPGMEKVYRACAEGGLPLLLHTGDNRFDYSNPPQIEKVLRDHPRLTVVGGHFSGLYHYTEAADTLSGYPNLFCDCSSSFVRLTPQEARHCLEKFGANKVMFGTDFPVCIPQYDLRFLFDLGLGDEALDRILFQNAVRIYGIDRETLALAGKR